LEFLDIDCDDIPRGIASWFKRVLKHFGDLVDQKLLVFGVCHLFLILKIGHHVNFIVPLHGAKELFIIVRLQVRFVIFNLYICQANPGYILCRL
jgi:hypothetical protein